MKRMWNKKSVFYRCTALFLTLCITFGTFGSGGLVFASESSSINEETVVSDEQEKDVLKEVEGGNADLKVKVKGTAEDIEKVASVLVERLSDERRAEYQTALEEKTGSNVYRVLGVYDIKLMDDNGEETEPVESVQVTLSGADVEEALAADGSITVFHNTADVTEQVEEQVNEHLQEHVLNETNDIPMDEESEEEVTGENATGNVPTSGIMEVTGNSVIPDMEPDTSSDEEATGEDSVEEAKRTRSLKEEPMEPVEEQPQVSAELLEEMNALVSDGNALVFATSSFSEYMLVEENLGNDELKLNLGTSENQVETKLHDKTYFEQDKYLSEPTGEINGQNTYDVYLEQALVDLNHPDKIENPAPVGMNVIMIIDQSSSMAQDSKINGLNNATLGFFKRIKALNEKRIAKGKAGLYSDVDPNGDVEAQMAGNMMRVTGIIGYNNHIYNRYRNVSGLAITSDAAVQTLANAARLKNDLPAYLAGDENADLQEETRTDLAFAQAEQWINEEGHPEKSSIAFVTDGRPTLKNRDGWNKDLGYINMSSITTNESLRIARRLKDQGTLISTVFIEWDSAEATQKAYETGRIEDVSAYGGWGLMAVFMSLMSSDYPKNGTFETSNRQFTGRYSYEDGYPNQFGVYTQLAVTMPDAETDLDVVVPPQIDAAGENMKRTGYASVNSMVQDTISAPFEKQEGVDIKVYKVPRIPANLGEDGIPTDMDDKFEVTDFRWGTQYYEADNTTLSEWEDITEEVSVSLAGNTVKVTGFDYEENAVTNFDKDTASAHPEEDATVYKSGDYGYKLVVVVPINAKTTFGGNQIATNNPDTTHFLPSRPTGRVEGEAGYLPPWEENTDLNPAGNQYVAKYPLPIVDLNVTYEIVSDDLIVYAPQTAEIHNLVTDTNNLLWYTDATYYDLKTAADNAKALYKEAEEKFNEYESSYGEIENPTSEDLQMLMDLEVAKQDALSAYREAEKELEKALNYTPDGLNNQFVNIDYELLDPDGFPIASLHIPHGKAYVTDENGNGNIDWNIEGGNTAIVTKSGTYTIRATVTPVDTDRAPGGLVYTGNDDDSVKETIMYSSEDFSSTGSSANGSQSPLMIEKNPTASLFQLKITTSDTRLTKKQALDFILGGENLKDTENIHIVGYEWVCTDGKTASVKENEPGITGLMKVGSGVTIISQIPEAAEQEGLVEDISGTIVVGADDGGYVPVSVILSRNIGNINKSVSLADQVTQKGVYMTDSDSIWGEGQNSVIWEHLCDIMTDWECDENEFLQSQKYNTAEDASGRGKVQYLIHVMDNPLPDITKSTSTPVITKGGEIKWGISIENSDEAQNPNRRTTEFNMVDILPYNEDGRIDPDTNREGSKFGGELKYQTISADFTEALSSIDKAVFYYTTQKEVRGASESQMMGDASSGNITWTEAAGTKDGNTLSFTVPADAVAIRMSMGLAWEERVSFSLTANLTDLSLQEEGDYYHNEAIVFAGNGIRTSNVVVTEVSSIYISGTIWEDTDSNGLMAAEEKRLQDVVVTLYVPYDSKNPNPVDREYNGIKLSRAYDGNGDMFASYTTLEDGAFSFEDVIAGTYYVIADYIPDKYEPTTKQAGKGEGELEGLDSEAEETFADDSSLLANVAWIKEIVVADQPVPNQNVGLREIRGKITVGKTLDEIYYPSNMSDEDREDYRVSFIFKLRNTDTGVVYSEPIYLKENTIHLYQGKPQVYATFADLPLGTYELSEVSEAQYRLLDITSDSAAVTFDKSSGIATIRLTSAESELDVLAENALDRTPPGGDENGVNNHIGMHIPVSLELTYAGPNPISSDTLTEYVFTENDFDPDKGGDIVVTYDDGSTASLSEGTLRFDQITLTPDVVTNRMNSGDNTIAITGYYSEKGRTLKDVFRVQVDLKPIHKFQLNFDANGSTFETGAQTNSVQFGYDDNTGQNFVIKGIYRDVPNGGMEGLNGFTFAGWNTKYDGSGQQYDSLSALDAIGKDTNISNLTLYANWKTTVTFNAQGGTMYDGTTTEEKALHGKTVGSITVSKNQQISTTLKGKKTNYHYVLWNTASDGTGTNIDNYGRVTGPVTFYAIYYQSDYGFTGAVQTFIAPVDGWYRVQLWGAKGGNDQCPGANGGYVSGEVHVTAGTRLYVYVGQPGRDSATGTGAGWNGGGNPGSTGCSGSGGGATSISTISGAWNNWSVLNARIAVAAGGGGGGLHSNGAVAGGLVGGTCGPGGSGGTQTSAGNGGGFGYGGTPSPDGGGGGGGYYGGGAGKGDNGGGGGSSYLSGYASCKTSYTGYVFRNGSIIAGNGYMPAPNGGYEVGHAGACYAYINLIEKD